MQLQQFRQTVYQMFSQRADATLDLVDALTVAGQVESPVALSTEAPFRRKFSSVYDVLGVESRETAELAKLLYLSQPAESERLGGYEV